MKTLSYIEAIVLPFTLFACNSPVNNTQENESSTLSFINKSFKSELTPDCDSCTKATINIPIARGDTIAAKNINDYVFIVAQKALGEEGKSYTGYDSLVAGFVDAYKKMKTKFPDGPAISWDGKLNGSVVKQTDRLVNIKLEAFTFTGGAHPNSNTYSLLFNAETGKKLAQGDVIKDIPALTALAEKKFREQLKIPAGTPVNSTIYTFDDNKFVLPKNIFFTDSGLQLYYNAYEIAPYYVGATIITLPYPDAEQYLAMKP
ncbi:DUF3298 and DUF4163 domain-containing protein [Parafilimonas terrae]|uniref:DUF3298 domain-containing protein n=1 Tax=Parafilimonas terrae TaxID=1465490 RepID=A0A1I5S2A8_9BACT|nr:DUF3298 and DUF4163 domain-containing protein [Parafilimonas terrae]SFP64883.1 protein of unknown function [Parafilimonas terrae]